MVSFMMVLRRLALYLVVLLAAGSFLAPKAGLAATDLMLFGPYLPPVWSDPKSGYDLLDLVKNPNNNFLYDSGENSEAAETDPTYCDPEDTTVIETDPTVYDLVDPVEPLPEEIDAILDDPSYEVPISDDPAVYEPVDPEDGEVVESDPIIYDGEYSDVVISDDPTVYEPVDPIDTSPEETDLTQYDPSGPETDPVVYEPENPDDSLTAPSDPLLYDPYLPDPTVTEPVLYEPEVLPTEVGEETPSYDSALLPATDPDPAVYNPVDAVELSGEVSRNLDYTLYDPAALGQGAKHDETRLYASVYTLAQVKTDQPVYAASPLETASVNSARLTSSNLSRAYADAAGTPKISSHSQAYLEGKNLYASENLAGKPNLSQSSLYTLAYLPALEARSAVEQDGYYTPFDYERPVPRKAKLKKYR